LLEQEAFSVLSAIGGLKQLHYLGYDSMPGRLRRRACHCSY
jgi:hypothetical protein